MRRPFLALLRKEVRQSLPIAGLLSGIFFLWFLLLLSLRWNEELLAGLALIPMAMLFFWIPMRSYAVWRRDWSGNHMQLLLALPVPGWWLAAAKLTALLLETAELYTTAFIGFVLVQNTLSPSDKLSAVDGGILFGAAAFLGLGVLAFVCYAAAVMQFAVMAGRLVGRIRWLLSLAAFLTGAWAVLRFAGLTLPLLKWLPPYPLVGFSISSTAVTYQPFFVTLATPVAALVGTMLLGWFGAWLLERHVEA